MKFISKSSNLLIVLKPGLQAQPLTGTPSVPTVSVRFKDGLADVVDEELIKRMLAHPAMNNDFISAEEVNGVDPYAYTREESEPAHIMTELKFGSPVGRQVKGGKSQLTPALAKLVQDEAVKLATAMLPSMIESTLQKIVEGAEKDRAAAALVADKKPAGKGKQAPEANPRQVDAA